MSVIYVASIGQTGATKKCYWDNAKAHFHYTESVVFCGKNLVEQLECFLDDNAKIVIIDNPFHGMDGYVQAIENIIKQIMNIMNSYKKFGYFIEEVVVNTSGGTEKMSCIIKDAVDVLKTMFPFITHVWGSGADYEAIYTVKGDIDMEAICRRVKAQYVKKNTNKNETKKEIELSNKPMRKKKKKIKNKEAILKKKAEQEKRKLIIIQKEKGRELRKKKAKEKRAKKETIRQEKHAAHMRKQELASKLKKQRQLLSNNKKE